MTAKERLKACADDLGMSERQFCIGAGLEPGYSKTFTGNPRPKYVRMLEKTYPWINIDWLKTGEGNMYKEGIERTVINSPVKIGDNSGNVAGGDITIGGSSQADLDRIRELEMENVRLKADVERLESFVDRLTSMIGKIGK